MSELIFATVALVLFAGGLLYFGIRSFRKARLIEDIPTAKVRSCAQGFAELCGTAAICDGAPLVSPLTGEPCVWYSFRIEEKSEDKVFSWKTVKRDISSREFMLKDDSGECAVYPKGADIKPARKRRWLGSTINPTPSNPMAAHLISSARYRYTEYSIKEGDFLYALGQFKTHRPGTIHQQAKTAMGPILTEWKRDYPSLLARFDTNGDGEICLDEWKEAQQAAYEQAYERVKSEHKKEGLHLMVAPPSPLPFIVSSKDPKQLCKTYRAYSYGCLAGIAACVYGLITLYGL